jgi:hypothetical protein
METIFKICSYCKGVNHNEAYKLKASNFSTIRVEIISPATSTPGNPMPMPHQHKTAIICNECLESSDNPIQPLLDVMTIAAVNDAETATLINK